MMISIIIPTIRSRDKVSKLVAEIEKTAVSEHETIVIAGNRSAAANRNIGLEKAKGEFIIMCDDDIEKLPHGWDRDLIDALKQTGASMVGARLFNPNGTLQVTNYRNFDLSKELVEVKIMITACCAFRKTALRFDENYTGSGYEDTDFCKQLGGKFFVTNKAKMIHKNEHKNPFDVKNGKYFKEKWG